jgi:prepilin-type N-terminal cleavage/methylation domain-containing protein
LGSRQSKIDPIRYPALFIFGMAIAVFWATVSLSNYRTNFGETSMKSKQSGFTLIEIAIVLVIIGLLLGGVMKGQELINSARVKNLATDFRNIPVFVYGYQDKFRALPGDDMSASTHLSASGVNIVDAASSVGGSGTINGKWDATGGSNSESQIFWQHVRLAGLAPGPTDASVDLRPTNAVGGKIGITNAADSPITGLKGSFIVCSNGIAGKFAKQLDITMDDGLTNSGSMQTWDGATGAVITGNIVDDTTYLVCMGF